MSPTIALTLTEFSGLTVRDWGLPWPYEGRMWRTSANRVCILLRRGDGVVVSTADWIRVPHRRLSVFPPGWLDAARAYRRQWPHSDPGLWMVSR